MTSGSWTEPGQALKTAGYFLQKTWNGGDGKYVYDPVPRLKWNDYSMVHKKIRFSGSPIDDNYFNVRMFRPSGAVEIRETTEYTTWCQNSVFWNDFQGNIVFSSMFNDNEELALLAKLVNKVRGHSYNMGVSIAEVDKFASSATSTVKNLGLGVIDLLSGRYGKFARRFGANPPNPKIVKKLMTKDVSGRFLEMRYCWEPVIKDVFDAAKAFEVNSRGPRVNTIKTSRTVTQDIPFDPAIYAGYLGMMPNRVRKAKRSYIIEMSEEMSFVRSMGLGNPATILWERIPWSFVVDWFIPIGSYLELVGQVPALKGRFLRTDSFRQTVSGKGSGVNPANIPYHFSSEVTVSIEAELFWLRRAVLGGLSVPTPKLIVQGSVQGKRLQNAIALAHQIFDKAMSPSRPKKGLGQGNLDTTYLRKAADLLGRI